MAVTINASTTSGLVMTSDLSGQLQFANNGVNLPMGGVAPAFSAYPNATLSITGTTFTKVLLQVEEFDTNNNFASSRFTPTVAGYYQISGSIQVFGSVAGAFSMIYKNGVNYKIGNFIGIVAQNPVSGVSALVYLNGSTDYIELYAYSETTATINSASIATWFTGSLVRGA